MSDHADTIRRLIEEPGFYEKLGRRDRKDEALAALDALLAENQRKEAEIQRLRDAIDHALFHLARGTRRDAYAALAAVREENE